MPRIAKRSERPKRSSFVAISRLLLAAGVTSAPAARGSPSFAPARPNLILLVRRANGRPLVRRKVTVALTDAVWTGFGSKPISISGRTGTRGRARLRVPPGLYNMRLRATGVGYCIQSGVRVARKGRLVFPIPRLVPYGQIHGRVIGPANQLRGLVVSARQQSSSFEKVPLTNGRFSIVDAPPGTTVLSLHHGKSTTEICIREVRLWPGQTVSGVTISLPPPPKPPPHPARGARVKEPDFVIVRGTIVCHAGMPAAGAKIVARSYYSGLQSGVSVFSAVSNATGHFTIDQRGAGAHSFIRVYGYLPGHPPAFARIPARPMPADGSWRPRVKPATDSVHLLLPAAGGSLRVCVLRDGHRLRRDLVTIERMNMSDRIGGGFPWLWPPGSSGRQSPTDLTSNRGVATFKNLTPGLYRVFAASGFNRAHPPTAAMLRGTFWRRRLTGWAHLTDIAVRLGKTTSISMALRDARLETRFRVFAANGHPVCIARWRKNTPALVWNEELEIGAIAHHSGSAQGLFEQAKDDYHRLFDRLGLYRLRVSLSTNHHPIIPIGELPYQRAAQTVAITTSREQRWSVPITCAQRRAEPLTVHVFNKRGKPIPAAVVVGNGPNSCAAAGATDARGRVVFRQVQSGSWDVHVYPISRQAIPPSRSSVSNPKSRPYFVMPTTQVATRANRRARVEVRPVPVGYIGVTLIPAPGVAVSRYTVFHGSNDQADPRAYCIRFPHTNRFLVGPLIGPKKALLRFIIDRRGHWRIAVEKRVRIRPGKTVHLTLHCVPKPAKISGDGSIQDDVAAGSGKAVLSDGRAPAYGAWAFLLNDLTGLVVAKGRADPDGRFILLNTALTVKGLKHMRANRSLVVLLPGTCGAAIRAIPRGRWQRQHVVLPPRIALRGFVTFGGKPVAGRAARIRILARYVGRGPFDKLLSVETCANADGSFVLGGLTPGR